jgi:translocator protein
MTQRFFRAPVLVAAGVAILVAGAGGAITDVGPWYQTLQFPSWKPPDWAFAPVWTVIFTLSTIVAIRCWEHSETLSEKQRVLGLFMLNAVLNFLWSALFFGLHRPDWALWEVGPLWFSVALLILGLRGLYKPTTAMLLPYLIWVAIAASLNAYIVVNNPPFGTS